MLEGEHRGEPVSENAHIVDAPDHPQGGRRRSGLLLPGHGPDPLAPGDFMPGGRPFRILLQAEGHRHRIFSGPIRNLQRKAVFLLSQRGHIRLHPDLRDFLAVPLQDHRAVEV